MMMERYKIHVITEYGVQMEASLAAQLIRCYDWRTKSQGRLDDAYAGTVQIRVSRTEILDDILIGRVIRYGDQ